MSRINRFLGQKLLLLAVPALLLPLLLMLLLLQLLSHLLPPSPSSNVTASWLAIRPTTAQTFL